MTFDFLQPIDFNLFEDEALYPFIKKGNVRFMEDGNYDPEEIHIAIIGIKESRGHITNQGCAFAPDEIRKALYALIPETADWQIGDLGNIESGKELSDTYAAVEVTIHELLADGITPIILGGSEDLFYGVYQALKKYYQHFNWLHLDEKLNLYKNYKDIHALSYIYKILTDEPNGIQHFSQLGYQSYYTEMESVELLNKLGYECIRLGNVREDLKHVEPSFRKAHAVTVTSSMMKFSDAPGQEKASPHGLYGEEFCQLMKYAGHSEQVNSLNLFGYNVVREISTVTANLFAQGIWYFLEGFYARREESPDKIREEFLQYVVDLQDESLEFYKSKKTGRWWMNVQTPGGSKQKYIPCSYIDYQMACKNELPERWVHAFGKV